ncbi:TPA_exp: Uncharacterized protein A8136_2193 [Trichophyton benhamiae CBS 112371]|nr:TPA_exp: Uncharacterized protein A8136_2193 [Trichophyton benhamiae CBS 112371]
MMELGFGDQDLIYEEEAKRLAKSAPVPRSMCLSCSKLVAEYPMLECSQAHPSTKCFQCVKANKSCHTIPPQFRGDLERIQAFAREIHVRPSQKATEQLQEITRKYVARIEAYELKEPTLEVYAPYPVPRSIPLPIPIDSPVKAVNPMNSSVSTEDGLASKARDLQQVNHMLNKIMELVSRNIDLPLENGNIEKNSESTWLHVNQGTIHGNNVNEAPKQRH